MKMTSENLSPFKAEMKKRGFTFIMAEDYWINDQRHIAVEIPDDEKPLVYGYTLEKDRDDSEQIYFETPLEDDDVNDLTC